MSKIELEVMHTSAIVRQHFAEMKVYAVDCTDLEEARRKHDQDPFGARNIIHADDTDDLLASISDVFSKLRPSQKVMWAVQCVPKFGEDRDWIHYSVEYIVVPEAAPTESLSGSFGSPVIDPIVFEGKMERRLNKTSQADRLKSIKRRTDRLSNDCSRIRSAVITCWSQLEQLIIDCRSLAIDVTDAEKALGAGAPAVSSMHVNECIEKLAMLDKHVQALADQAEKELDSGLDMTIADKYLSGE